MKKLLIVILSGVAVFWLTQGVIMLWPIIFPPAPPPSNIAFNGRVIDSDKRILLSGAEVSFGIANTVTTDQTDSDGRYAFSIPKPAQSVVAVLTVSAQGYQPYSRQLPSVSWDQAEQDLYIVPIPPAVQPPPPDPHSNPASPPPVVQPGRRADAVVYMPRKMPAVVKFSPALMKR